MALLSRALAPVLRALGAGGEAGEGSTGRGCAERAQEEGGLKGLPEMEYPAPLFVRNTFIEASLGRPVSLVDFLEERGVRSSPASAIGAVEPRRPWEGGEEEFAATAKFGDGLARLLEADTQDGAASRRSTSVGSLSPRSPDEKESPAGEAFMSCDADSREVPKVEPSPLGAHCARGLPEFEYPPVKNTFIHASIGRPLSLDGFYEERQLRSCPASGIYAHLGLEDEDEYEEEKVSVAATDDTEAAASAAAANACGAMAGGAAEWVVEACDDMLETPPCMSWSWPSGLPLPPAEPPILASMPPSPCAPCGVAMPPVLLLAQFVEAPAIGSPELPTIGSADHATGSCRPCAHAYSRKGCKNGVQCTFCHLCPPGELKRQQKAKRQAQRWAMEVGLSA